MSFNFGATTAAAPAPASGFNFGAGGTTAAAPAAGGGGFSFGGGAAAATPAPAAGGGGFSFGATPAPAASTGFSFGGGATTTAAAAPASSGGFSFGTAAPAATTIAPASSGGFSFGGTTTATAAPASSGGFSFGGATTTAAAAPASSGGFSFGAAAPATSTSSSLFGGAATTTGTTPSLFGGSGAATTGGSLFGGATAAKPAGTGFFGAGTTTTGGGFTGFGTAQQPQQLAPGQPAITLETVFDALPADVKKNITDFHKFLKEEDQSDAFLKSVSSRKQEELNRNLEQLEQDVLVRRNLQDRQATAVHHVRKDVKHVINQVDAATLNLRSMSGESTSQRFYGIMRRVEVPSPYYWELLDNFEGRMEQIKSQIESIESEYRPLYEKNNRSSAKDVDPAMLHQILIAQNTAMIQIAAQVAEVHERTEEMRQLFIRKMKEDLVRHGDKNLTAFKNPFDKRKKNSSHESDIDNIRFKTSVAPTIVASQPPPQQQPQATGFGFGTTGTSAFGTTGTSSFGTTTTGGTSLFGQNKPTVSTGFGTTQAATAAPAATGGFNFGGATNAAAAPKQVSFSLGGSTAPTVSTGLTSTTTPAASGGFSFGGASAATPTISTGGFGGTSSFLPPTATPALGAGDKRAAGASGGLRTRQKKR